jgi:predicted NBD/HSP70 family sugar kinase
MSNLVLWIVLAACALAVLGALAYLGLRGYRLVRTGMRVSRGTGAQAKQLAEKAAAVQAKAAVLAETGEWLGEGATGLQTALARLTILISAITEARAPWQGLTRFLRK